MAKMAVVRDQATISYRTWFHLAYIAAAWMVGLFNSPLFATVMGMHAALGHHSDPVGVFLILTITMQLLVLLACAYVAQMYQEWNGSSSMFAVPYEF